MHTYRINTDDSRVDRIDETGQTIGYLTFRTVAKLTVDGRWMDWIEEKEGREVYLIARDELIERGLIQEE